MRNWQPTKTQFDCSVIGQTVTVAISTLDLYGQRQFPIDQLRRMDGCSGNQICKIFPVASAFHTQGPWGCPRIEIPESSKLIYVFEVRQSLRSPHLPIPSDERIFWKRQGLSCVQMTLEEIRYQMNNYEEKREKFALLMIDLHHKVEALKREAQLSPGGWAPEFGQTYSFDVIDRVMVEAYSFLKGDRYIFKKLDEFRAHLSGLNAAKQRVLLTAASPVPLMDRNVFLEHQVRLYHGQLTSVSHRATSLAHEIRQSIKDIAGVDDPYEKD